MKTILVIDDDADSRGILEKKLSDLGSQARFVENADDAERIFQTEKRPLITLAAVTTRDIDGMELMRRIQAADPDTVIIVLCDSGEDDPLSVKYIKLGAVDVISKPVNKDRLEIALKRAWDKISLHGLLREKGVDFEKLIQDRADERVKSERRASLNQVVEGLSAFITNIGRAIDDRQENSLDDMHCFISIQNRDIEVISSNKQYKNRLLDKTKRHGWEIYRGLSADREECPVGKTFRTQSARQSDETVVSLDGKEIPVIVYTTPIKNIKGEIELVLEIAADFRAVTDLLKKLRRAQRKHRRLFNEVPCYISVQDRDLRVMASNKRFKEDFGEGLGEHCYKIYKHRKDPCYLCPVQSTFQDGVTHQTEEAVTAKSGEQYIVLTNTAPIRDASGEIVFVMEMSTNITQIRNLQDHLTSLGLLIGSMSHGIRGLLTALDGGIYRLESGIRKKDQDKVNQASEVIKDMVERIRHMVLDILYYAKDRDLNWSRVSVLNFAEDVASIVKPRAEEHGITFVCDFNNELSEFEIDPGVADSALVNLLENAVDACLYDRNQKNEYKITFSVKESADEIIFDIHDNGIGMDQETKENIFTLFFSSKGHRGTGLGLFISNKVVEQHGGTITVDSTPGQGSHFTIRIPKHLNGNNCK